MKRNRTIFIVLIVLAILSVGSAAFLKYGPPITVTIGSNQTAPLVTALATSATAKVSQNASVPKATSAAIPEVAVTAMLATVAPQPVAAASDGKFAPVWGASYKENDGLGKLVCGAYAFSADYVLQQIQISGLDVKHGFHLGIVPFYLDQNYVVTAKERTDLVQSGQLDCLLTTFDLIALQDPGVLTAFINESAGGDQIWARGVKSLNELKGKRIAFEADGPSEYFLQDLLATVQLTPKDVTLLPQPDQNSAIAVFNKDEADVVAGWTPVIFDAEKSGGQLLASSKEFRSILGGIVMSRQAMQSKRTVIQLFHDAWFEALAQQEGDFGKAAKQIAGWGHTEYLGMKPESAEDDLRQLLEGVAQANLGDNVRAFSNVSAVINRLLQARNLWAATGHAVPGGDVTAIVNPEFVQASARAVQVDLNATNKFVNNSFSLGRSQVVVPLSAGSAPSSTASSPQAIISNTQTVATLPCSRFEFVPNSTQMQPDSQKELRDCAVRVLQQNVFLYVRVKGSSAWPGPKGAIPQARVESTAKERAQSIVDFLVAQGINKDRFVVEWALPPPDHRETTDVGKQAQDRYVEISLLTAGL